MLLSVDETNVLFLIRFNNFALTMYGLLLELHALTLVTRSYALLHWYIPTDHEFKLHVDLLFSDTLFFSVLSSLTYLVKE